MADARAADSSRRTGRVRHGQIQDSSEKRRQSFRQKLLHTCNYQTLKQTLLQFWRSTERYQTRRVAVISGITIFILLTIGSILLRLEYPNVSLKQAFSATVSLLLGGYSDVFGGLDSEIPVSWWTDLFSIGLTLAGTAFIGVLYALDAIFEGANEITRVSDCSISVARQLMASLPTTLPFPLYKQQAQWLIRHLSKVQVMAHLIAMS